MSTGSSGILRSGLGAAINALGGPEEHKRAHEVVCWEMDERAADAREAAHREPHVNLSGDAGRALREDELDEDADAFLTWICRYPVEVSRTYAREAQANG